MVFMCRINCFIVFFFLTCSPALWARSSAQVVKEGNRLYKQGLYEEAARDYDTALTIGGQESVARYNLGNALYKKGKAKEDKDIDAAIKDMEQSVAD